MAFGIKSNVGDESEGLKPLETKASTEQVQANQEPPKPEAKKPVEQKTEAPKPADEKPQEPKKETPQLELNDDVVSQYLKNKYKDREFSSLDDFVKTPEPIEKEVEKVVNPWEGVIDDEEAAYLTFKKETGRGRKEWEFINQDINAKSPLELCREKIRQDTGLKLSNAEADEYIEKKLGVDLSETDLSVTDKIELNAFIKDYKSSLLEQQEKYRKPLEEKLQAKASQPKMETVQLEDGTVVSKKAYDDYQEQRRIYQEQVIEAGNSVTAIPVTFEVDINGESQQINFNYEPSKDAIRSAIEDSRDVDAMIKKRFHTEQGFNHKKLIEKNILMDENNLKLFSKTIYEQAYADAVEQMASSSNNENYTRRPLETSKKAKDGYGELPSGNRRQSAFGVRASGLNH